MQLHKPVVLFLSSDNSVRSQIAEALLRHTAGDKYEVHSAGLSPTQVHPLVYRVLDEEGIDSSGLEAKSVMQFLARKPIAVAVILCEPEPGSPRIYPFAPNSIQWPIPEPSLSGIADEEEALNLVRSIRNALGDRIQTWLADREEVAPLTSESVAPPAVQAPAAS